MTEYITIVKCCIDDGCNDVIQTDITVSPDFIPFLANLAEQAKEADPRMRLLEAAAREHTTVT